MSVAELSKEFWEFRLRHRPEFAIFKGIIPPIPQLDSYTVEAFKERKEFCEILLAKTKRIDVKSLTSQTDMITVKLLQYYTNTIIQYDKYEQYLMPLDYAGGPDSFFVRYTLPKLPFQSEADYEYYIELIKCFSKQVAEVQHLLGLGVKKSIVPNHASVVPAALQRIKDIADAKPEDTFFFGPFASFPDSIPVDLRTTLVERGRAVIREFGQKPCQALHDILVQHYVPVLRHSPSIDLIPGAPGRYEAMLKYNCDTDISPREIHNIGLRAVKDNLDRMHKVLEKVGFSGSIQEFSEHLKKQQDQWFKSNEEAIEYCHHFIESVIKPKLSACFFPLERDHPLDIGVEPTNKSSTKAIYINPSADGTVPGRILLEPHFATTVPKYEIPVLLLHEAWPGHHMQASYILDKPGLPEFRLYKDERHYFLNPGNFPMNVAYTEGWGLYCEGLGEDFGLYDNPLDEFGYLLHDSMRCCRVVVDTGLHALGWSKQEAVQYMKDHTALSDRNIKTEVDRYITLPAQACSYKIGQLRLKSLRERCQSELGARFDLREFHDICLSTGQVPLDLVEELAEKYINDTKSRIL